MAFNAPSIRFFSGRNGQRIAYARSGDGPPIVLPAWWVSHLERDFADRRFQRFFETLSECHSVVRYDRPGVGLSERERHEWSLESEVGQLEALIDHLKLDKVSLLGFSCGAPAAVAYSARHPERVSKLILVAAYAEGQNLAKPDLQKAMVDLTRASWGIGSRTLSDLMAPDLTKQEIEHIAAQQRASCKPDVAARLLQLTFELECQREAATLDLPTLVLHRRGDRTIRLEAGRALAAQIPNADFRVLDGDAHVPWQGDQGPLLEAVLGFLGERKVAVPETEVNVAERAEALCVWRRDGDLWHLRFAGKEVLLAHRKGLDDLLTLLSHPMREISAVELRDGFDAAETSSLGGSDEALDDRARKEYAFRLRDLTGEIADAEACHDLGRLESLQVERDALLDQVSAAQGIWGRTRRIGDPGERARKAISARIRDAIRRISQVHPSLGEHLKAAIRTGRSCVYRPETERLWDR